jgi:hypothetical protein
MMWAVTVRGMRAEVSEMDVIRTRIRKKGHTGTQKTEGRTWPGGRTLRLEEGT